MGERITREAFLEKIFSRSYEELRGKDLRLVREKVPGKEIDLAHVIGVSQTPIYHDLSLHIGTHLGEDHTGESIGILDMTPWESTIAAADVAMKSGDVELGFLDRFSGTVIVLGQRAEVKSALEHVLDYFRDELHFVVCPLTEN